MDQFGFVEPVDRLGERVVVAIADTADVVVPYWGGRVSPLKPLDPSTLDVWLNCPDFIGGGLV